jgi:hypothetical protein
VRNQGSESCHLNHRFGTGLATKKMSAAWDHSDVVEYAYEPESRVPLKQRITNGNKVERNIGRDVILNE